MIYRFEPGALADLDAAFQFYEERHEGLGWRFLEVVETAAIALCDYPGMGEEVAGDEGRRWVLAGFPYLLYYRITDEIVVDAVIHGRRRLQPR